MITDYVVIFGRNSFLHHKAVHPWYLYLKFVESSPCLKLKCTYSKQEVSKFIQHKLVILNVEMSVNELYFNGPWMVIIKAISVQITDSS